MEKVDLSFLARNKLLDGSVVGTFCRCGEKATRKLSVPTMVKDAFAAFPLPWTRFIGACALGLVFLNLTFHLRLRFSNRFSSLGE
jgi:hypothetical protein